MISKTAHILRTFLAAVLCAALFATVVPSLAGAASPHQPQGFNGGGGASGGNERTGLSARVGPLPFTGFDVMAMGVVALAVTGLGLGLRRAVSRRPHEDVGDSAPL